MACRYHENCATIWRVVREIQKKKTGNQNYMGAVAVARMLAGLANALSIEGWSIAAAGSVTLVAMVAALIPAMRRSMVDPAQVLRE